MGIFSENHYHNHDVKVQEQRAPIDESIRILNEMQEKVIDNIIAKVSVNDNLVNGEVWAIDMKRMSINLEYKIICKFKINGIDFVVEKDIDMNELGKIKQIQDLNKNLLDYGKSIMIWFALKQFAIIAYKQILNTEPPKYILRSFYE